jgi:hypothetical protein
MSTPGNDGMDRQACEPPNCGSTKPHGQHFYSPIGGLTINCPGASSGPAGERRDWAVVLYSGECEEHPGLLCAMQAVGPCTLAESDQVLEQVPPGFTPHRVALLPPADLGIRPPAAPGGQASTGQ